MTSVPFATAQEIADRLGVSFSTAEETQADAYCEDASDLIREYCRQELSLSTGLVMRREAPEGPWLDLPQRPVVSVSSVTVNGQAVTDYSQIGDRLYRVYGWAWPSVDTIPPMAIYGLKSIVEVTYDAGNATVPNAVAATCRRMVIRAMSNPTGVARESIDDYTVQRLSDRGGVFLDDDDKKALRRYRRGAFEVNMGGRIS